MPLTEVQIMYSLLITNPKRYNLIPTLETIHVIDP